jgi:hypothetical protein
LQLLKKKLLGKDLAVSFRIKETDFTRDRKQSFSHALLFMFNLLRKSLGVEIDNFIRFMTNKLSHVKAQNFTTSAFVQNRKKIKPEVFKYLSDIIVENYYQLEEDNLNLFYGFRLLAVDGSILTLPNHKDLIKEFGVKTNQSNVISIQARASVLYDVLNNFVIDSDLSSMNVTERDQALMFQSYWQANDLIIYDRGYPGFYFFKSHLQQSINFLCRIKVNHNNVVVDFVNSKKKSAVVEWAPNHRKSSHRPDYDKNERIEIRLIRVELPNGEIEILATSLLDSKKYPTNIFKELYFKRWAVETFYGELKNKLKIEYFSGYSKQSIMQDFYCTIFISNLQSMIINDCKEGLEIKNKNTIYEYKINANASYGFLKNRVLELICSNTSVELVLKELQDLLLEHTVPIRKNRKNPRNKELYKRRNKPKVLKNHKDTI